MSSIIIIKKKQSPKNEEFFEAIDNYFESQGIISIAEDDVNKFYYTDKKLTLVKLKEYVNVIKSTENYKNCVSYILSQNTFKQDR